METRFEQPTKSIAFAAMVMIIGALYVSGSGAYELRHAVSLATKLDETRSKTRSLLEKMDALIIKAHDPRQSGALVAQNDKFLQLLREQDELAEDVQWKKYWILGQIGIGLLVGATSLVTWTRSRKWRVQD